jgi:hypothetical protein
MDFIEVTNVTGSAASSATRSSVELIKGYSL